MQLRNMLGLSEKRKEEKREENYKIRHVLEVLVVEFSKDRSYEVCETFVALGSFTHALNMSFSVKFFLESQKSHVLELCSCNWH